MLGKWLNIHDSNPDKKILANTVSEHTPGFISVNYYKDSFGSLITSYLVNKSGKDRLRGYRLAYDGTDKQAALSAARNTPGVQLDFVWSNTPKNLNDDYQFVPFEEAFGHGAGRTGNPRPRSSAYIVDRYIAPVMPSERLRGETPREKVLEATPATVDGYRVAYLSREGDNRYTRDNTHRFYALKPDGTPDPDCYASQQVRGWLVSCYEDTTRIGSRKDALAYLANSRR